MKIKFLFLWRHAKKDFFLNIFFHKLTWLADFNSLKYSVQCRHHQERISFCCVFDRELHCFWEIVCLLIVNVPHWQSCKVLEVASWTVNITEYYAKWFMTTICIISLTTTYSICVNWEAYLKWSWPNMFVRIKFILITRLTCCLFEADMDFVLCVYVLVYILCTTQSAFQ